MDPTRKNLSVLLETGYKVALDCIKHGDWSKARALLLAIIELNPQYPEANLRLKYVEGREALNERNWDCAIQKFKEIPNFKDSKKLLSTAEEKKEADSLVQQARQIIREQEIQPIGDQEWNRAATLLLKAKRLDPKHKEVSNLFAEVKKYQKAQKVASSDKEPIWKETWFWGAVGVTVAVLVGIGTIYATIGAPKNTPNNSAPTFSGVFTNTTLSPSTSTVTIAPTEPIILYPTPVLLRPSDGASISRGEEVKLEWEWKQVLAETEFFEVRIRPEGQQEFRKLNLTKLRSQIVLAADLTQTGVYEWQVAVVTLSGKEMILSDIWWFEIE